MKRIAIVDDVATNNLVLKGFLSTLERVEIVTFTDAGEALAWCQEYEPDLILVDYQMPHINGLDFLRHVRRDRRMQETPLMMVTANKTAEMMYEVLNCGFADFLTKPVDRLELLARAKNMLQLRTKQRELKVLNRKLLQLSLTDALTGLPNRRAFLDSLNTEIDKCVLGRSNCCLAILDIDRFKSINDTWGHLAGDAVLSSVSRAISRVEANSAGRIGGEEFAILFSDVSLQAASERCEELLEFIRQTVTPFGGFEIKATSSIGLAAWQPKFTDTTPLFAAADAALYQAKQNGRDRVSIADHEAEPLTIDVGADASVRHCEA